MPETLPIHRRNTEPLLGALTRYGMLLKKPKLLGYLGSGGFFYGGMYAYVSGTPFAYIDYHHVSAQHYGLLFGVGIVGIMATNLLNARLVGRLSSDSLMRAGTAVAALAGVTPAALDAEAAARELVARGVGAVAVSLGPDGAFVATRGAEARIRPPAVPVVSTVGAGDAMVAGILTGLTSGRDVIDATRLGVALGSATCLTPAGQPANDEDIARLDTALAVTI